VIIKSHVDYNGGRRAIRGVSSCESSANLLRFVLVIVIVIVVVIVIENPM
jgi:hypothetical protein